MKANAQVRARFICLTAFVDMLGVGMISPILPGLVQELTGLGAGAAATQLAVIMASFSLVQFICAPVLGALSDRFGRRPLMLLALGVSAACNAVIAFAPSLTILFATRLLAGATAAKVAVASAYLADISSKEERAARFGMLGMAISLGFVMGPAVGGLLGAIDLRLPYLVAAIVQAANVLYAAFALLESLPGNCRRPFSGRSLYPGASIRQLFRAPQTSRLSSVLLLFGFANVMFQSVWVLYTGQQYGWGPTENGVVIAAMSASMALSQGKLSPVLVARLGAHKTLILGVAAGAVGNLLVGACDMEWVVVPAIALCGMSFVAVPAARALMSSQFQPDEQGTLQGALTSAEAVQALTAPFLASALFAQFAQPGASELAGAPYLFASGVLALALWAAVAAAKGATLSSSEVPRASSTAGP